jgi:hypothetical protein
MASSTDKKGINFKMTPKRKLCVIHPDTFIPYLQSLPRNDNGWVAFDYKELSKLTERNLFAQITPLEVKKAG